MIGLKLHILAMKVFLSDKLFGFLLSNGPPFENDTFKLVWNQTKMQYQKTSKNGASSKSIT